MCIRDSQRRWQSEGTKRGDHRKRNLAGYFRGLETRRIMAAFEYTALDSSGKKVSGILEADSARQARQLLRDQSLLVTDIESSSAVVKKSEKLADRFGFGWSLSTFDRVLFIRQLSTLVASSMPIADAFKGVADQTEKQRLSGLIMSIRIKVKKLSLIHI